MPTYAYEALDASGRTVRARMDAENQDALLEHLREGRYRVTSVREVRPVPLAGLLSFAKRVRLKDLTLFTRQFAVMVEAGMPVVKSLDILQAQTDSVQFAQTLDQVKTDVRAGVSLADALGRQRGVFSDLYVNMIRAAEAGGILDTVLNRLAQYLEKEMEIRNKVVTAMTYPILVLGFAGVAVAVIVFYLLPQFKEVFDEMNVTLPWTTRTLIATSIFFRDNIWLIPVIVVVPFVAVRIYGRSEKGRYNIDAAKLRIPILGTLLHKMALARFSRTLGTLLASGIPIMRALEIVADTAGNLVISTSIHEIRESVREGESLSEPMSRNPLFPIMVTQMVAVGEQTGRHDTMLSKVADFYDDEVDNTIKKLTSILEPIMIVGLGVLVGFIAVSVITPIYDLAASI